MPKELEVFNKFFVSMYAGGKLVLMNPPRGPISPEDARLLAAYLVSMSGGRDVFLPVLDAVENT